MKRLLLIIALLPFGLVNAQIENGMVAHFPFDNDFSDVSSSSIMALNNGAVFGFDRNTIPNNAIVLNGNEYVSFNDNAVKVQFPVTMSAWVNFNNTGGFNIVFTSDNVFSNYYGYFIGVTALGEVAIGMHGGLGMQSSTNRRNFTTTNTAQAGIWHHIVGIIRDYDDMTVYIDCVEEPGIYGGSGSTTVVYSTGESRVGSIIGSTALPIGSYFDGSIDQLAIWDRELNGSEITLLCNTNNSLVVDEVELKEKELVKIIDMMGRETLPVFNTPLIYIYSDGTTERIINSE